MQNNSVRYHYLYNMAVGWPCYLFQGQRIQGQGQRIPKQRNLALRPRIDIPGICWTWLTRRQQATWPAFISVQVLRGQTYLYVKIKTEQYTSQRYTQVSDVKSQASFKSGQVSS